ncbi:MAG TPA: ABC transporter permease, partial [Chryseosolibacter sp.]
MFRNYLKLLLRLMLKQKGFSLINITGLTVGIACSVLIMLYVLDELRYDRFHQDAPRIFRVGATRVTQGSQTRTAQTGLPLAEAIRTIDGVESSLRIAAWKTFPVTYEDKAFTEQYLILTDPNFFTFFSFNLIEGDPDSVLLGKGKVVITESAAQRYFNYRGKGDTSPVGKTLLFAQGSKVTISGVAEDPPVNSHFHFTLLLSLSPGEPDPEQKEDWLSGLVITYYKLRPGVDASLKGAQVEKELEKYSDLYLRNVRDPGQAALTSEADRLRYFIQPLQDIHLKSNLPDEIETNGSTARIFLLGMIALFITLLACINFMNLSTAQSSTRAKEIAV